MSKTNKDGLPVGRPLTQAEVNQYNSRERVKRNKAIVEATTPKAATKPKAK